MVLQQRAARKVASMRNSSGPPRCEMPDRDGIGRGYERLCRQLQVLAVLAPCCLALSAWLLVQLVHQ